MESVQSAATATPRRIAIAKQISHHRACSAELPPFRLHLTGLEPPYSAVQHRLLAVDSVNHTFQHQAKNIASSSQGFNHQTLSKSQAEGKTKQQSVSFRLFLVLSHFVNNSSPDHSECQGVNQVEIQPRPALPLGHYRASLAWQNCHDGRSFRGWSTWRQGEHVILKHFICCLEGC